MIENYRPAPDIVLTAAVTKREFSYRAPGATALLICLTQETQKEAEAIEEAVRARWPLASDLLVVYVIDLRKVPGVFRGMAEMVMEKEYTKSLDLLTPDQAPVDYVIITPDWHGETAKALDLDAKSSALSLIVLTADGRLAGTLNGASATEVESVIEAAISA